ncbi:hypothetical protein H1R20_g12340, partial [Candolleomyces eurysporus]
MYHFASTYGSPGLSGQTSKSDKHSSLNATQQKSQSNPFFLQIEEELHDARRVQSDGQEDDLRSALDMVINRVSELSTLLSEAYKAQAELEVQLNVTKSNLALVSANNEMLEEALKRNNAAARDLGWRRGSGHQIPHDPRTNLERSQSVDYVYPGDASNSPPASAGTPTETRFFKFRFSSASAASSRPGTPSNAAAHLTSPSLPSLSSTHAKELEDMAAELEKERAAKKAISEEKAALEEELESLSQALFEEANKMVAQERMKRSETEEELKEIKLEKEALQSALRLLDGQNKRLRKSSSEFSFVNAEASASGEASVPDSLSGSPPSRTHSRSSSEVGVKSRPESLDLRESLPPLPPSPFPEGSATFSGSPPASSTQASSKSASGLAASSQKDPADSNLLSPSEEESQPTPKYHQPPLHAAPSTPVGGPSLPPLEESPWADVPPSAELGTFSTKGLGGTGEYGSVTYG